MIGRKEHLASLDGHYLSDKNNFTILYGRHGIGKSTLIREFAENKRTVYFEAVPADGRGMFFAYRNAVSEQLGTSISGEEYTDVFRAAAEKQDGSLLFIFEEFQNIVKIDKTFMDSVARLAGGAVTDKKVMIILTSSSVAWIENSMVRAIGEAAFSINVFIKLRELGFADIVEMYPECDVRTALYMYAVTGGVPAYLKEWDADAGVKSNICRLFLKTGAVFDKDAEKFIRDEFREISVYNTLLNCLASGKNKLNEIHEATGYGRDKISVYLNNLIEREIVEKVFSYDAGGSRNVRKGLYRIKDGFCNFWYALVYPRAGMLGIMDEGDFYDRYVAAGLDNFALEAFIKVAAEFLEIMSNAGRLAVKAGYKGRWYGKTGNIHIIYENDAGEAVVAQVYADCRPVGEADYEELTRSIGLAEVNAVQIFLFSAGEFDTRLAAMQSQELMLIRIEDL